MERNSDKHSPRVDEQLKHDVQSIVRGSPVEARAEEAREQEGPADGEPTPDALLTGGRASATPDVLSHDEVGGCDRWRRWPTNGLPRPCSGRSRASRPASTGSSSR